MPRLGTCTERKNASSSTEFAISLRYATRSRTSRRLKKLTAPTTRWGIDARRNASSKARDWELVRYSTAISAYR